MKPIPDRAPTLEAWQKVAATGVNGLIRRVAGQGATSERPGQPGNGQMFYDNTLKQPIWWNAEDGEWKDAAGVAA